MQFSEQYEVSHRQQRPRSERLPPPGRQRARSPRLRVRPRGGQRHARSVLMPVATAAAVRKQIAQRRPDPIYLIRRRRRRGDVPAGRGPCRRSSRKSFAPSTSSASTHPTVRSPPAAIVEAARLVPMMALASRRDGAARREAAEAETPGQGGRDAAADEGGTVLRRTPMRSRPTLRAPSPQPSWCSSPPTSTAAGGSQAAPEDRDDRRVLGLEGAAGTRAPIRARPRGRQRRW